ncbi:SF0329 family protein [Bacillus sp. Marseille-P3661]|uniref:SF0329 family protein n=1 Tax=Bacillus sp. Marseille-P3661 TaxID=1936234 RepID=UPI003F8D1B45
MMVQVGYGLHSKKKEILSVSDVTYAIAHVKLYQKMKEKKNLKGIPYDDDVEVMFASEERQQLIKSSSDAEEIMINQNIFESYFLYAAFMEYATLSIDEAMNSENIIIKAYSMLDRRLGKRRLEKLELTQETHPLIADFYKIRCDVEGLMSGSEGQVH